MSQENSDFNTALGMKSLRSEDGVCEMSLDVDARHMSIAERVHVEAHFCLLYTSPSPRD